MIKSLAKWSIAIAVASAGASGCAVPADDGGDEIASTESALRTTYPVYGRATYDANLGATMVDIATTQIPPIDVAPDHDPHISSDQFFNVRVRLVGADGTARIATALGGAQIGPGGGCIHFNVPGAVSGDTLFVDTVVRIGTAAPRAGHSGALAVVDGDWVNDPTVELHPHD